MKFITFFQIIFIATFCLVSNNVLCGNIGDSTHVDSLKTFNRVLAGKPKILKAKPFIYKQDATINCKYLGPEQGLNTGAVVSIIEAQDGFMWFSTWNDGVARYDGEVFEQYTVNEGLNHGFVTDIIQQSNGIFWFATKGGGITRFDGKYFEYITEDEGLSSNEIKELMEDKKGDVWIVTAKGLDKFITSENRVVRIDVTANEEIHTIYEDSRGNIWLGTWGNGLYKYLGDSLQYFGWDEGLRTNHVICLEEDKSGNLWFGTWDHGVFRYDGEKFEQFTSDDGLCSDRIYRIKEDIAGNIWFGTFANGLMKYVHDSVDGRKTGSGKFTCYNVDDGLVDNSIKEIFEDSKGNLWLGAQRGGLMKLQGETFTNYTKKHGLSDKRVNCMYRDKKDNLWFGIWDGGLIRYDHAEAHKTGTGFTFITTEDGLSSNYVSDIIEDEKGRFIFATWGGGITIMDREKLSYLGRHNKMYSNYFRSVTIDKAGDIWYGMESVGMIKIENERIVHYVADTATCILPFQHECRGGLAGNNVTKILKDQDNNILFLCHGQGVAKYNGKNFIHFVESKENCLVKTEHVCFEGLSSNLARTGCVDGDGNLWLGTIDKGVTKIVFNGDSVKMVYFNESNGLQSNKVSSIFEASNKKIWIGTDNGLSCLTLNDKYDKKTGDLSVAAQYNIKNYEAADGFNGGGCSTNAIIEDVDGNIWIGTNKYLTKYRSNHYDHIDTIPPQIHLKSVNLFFREVNWDRLEIDTSSHTETDNTDFSKIKFDSLTGWYNLPVGLEMPYNQNHISFNFIGINWRNQENISYRYMLEGLDNTWSPVTDQTIAIFSSLPPGFYTFRVEAGNADGFWSKEPASFSFTILGPWWESTLFRAIVIAFILVVTGSYIKWRERKLKRDKQVLERAVMERTSEILQQKEEIETQRDEIMHQQTMVSELYTELTSSIEYAQRIQKAALPTDETMYRLINQHFILYKPRSIVSGDFYWASRVKNYLLFAVVDCTGHGVPGAFMSMLGIAYLNEIANWEDVTQAGHVLDKLRENIIRSLQQLGYDSHYQKTNYTKTGEPDSHLEHLLQKAAPSVQLSKAPPAYVPSVKDGMDASICVIDETTNILQFAGANNPIYIIRGETSSQLGADDVSTDVDGKHFDFGKVRLTEIKGDNMPVAIYIKMRPFKNHEIQLHEGDQLYLFTDGFPDQFGGEKGKKFKYKPFKQLLVENSHLPMKEQQEVLDREINDWMTHRSRENNKIYDQIDDITIMGVRI